MGLSEQTSSALRRITIERQSKGRVPGVAAGVVRHGDLLWHEGIGSVDLDEPGRAPGPDDQFLIASITKTFTAVMVMQLRDEGRRTRRACSVSRWVMSGRRWSFPGGRTWSPVSRRPSGCCDRASAGTTPT